MAGAERGQVDAGAVKRGCQLRVGDSSVVFEVASFSAVELDATDTPALQRFFERSPEYFDSIFGEVPSPDEVISEVLDPPPAGWNFAKNWILGFVDEQGNLSGISTVVSDLLAPGVWHIGLFALDASLHGSGAGHRLFAGVQSWARDSGAQWLRLGVVEGNTRAERFWQRCGFTECRTRSGINMGQRCNTIRVMVKPLAAGTQSDYLFLVKRDRPESE